MVKTVISLFLALVKLGSFQPYVSRARAIKHAVQISSLRTCTEKALVAHIEELVLTTTATALADLALTGAGGG